MLYMLHMYNMLYTYKYIFFNSKNQRALTSRTLFKLEYAHAPGMCESFSVRMVGISSIKGNYIQILHFLILFFLEKHF